MADLLGPGRSKRGTAGKGGLPGAEGSAVNPLPRPAAR